MKVKDAKNMLSSYEGNELYQTAIKLYQEETDSRINLRSQGKTPSRNVIDSVVNEMKPWMEKVGTGLAWDDNGTLQRMIEWETGKTWVIYGITDPRVEEYRKDARLEMLKGNPYPLFVSLTQERLDAVTSMMMAQIQKEASEYFDEHGDEMEEKIRQHFADREKEQE
mgnify:CR=1 FL=1